MNPESIEERIQEDLGAMKRSQEQVCEWCGLEDCKCEEIDQNPQQQEKRGGV